METRSSCPTSSASPFFNHHGLHWSQLVSLSGAHVPLVLYILMYSDHLFLALDPVEFLLTRPATPLVSLQLTRLNSQQRQAHEQPVIFYSLVIGFAGPLMVPTVPAIRTKFGWKRPEPIPLTYPSASFREAVFFPYHCSPLSLSFLYSLSLFEAQYSTPLLFVS